MYTRTSGIGFATLILCLHLLSSAEAETPAPAISTPTGKSITPTAAAGAVFQDLNPEIRTAPDQRAGRASAIAVSRDGRLLAVLTSGMNVYYSADGKVDPERSAEYVFLFDLGARTPAQLQVLRLSNSFYGLAWSPSSEHLYASGGQDDTVVEFVRIGAIFTAGRTLQLHHKAGLGLKTKPVAAGLAVSPDGSQLLVANLQNDSVSMIDLAKGQVIAEQDLRPGLIDANQHGVPGGSYPRSVVWSSAHHAYVASERDREILSLDISLNRIRVVRRMPVPGQPVALITNRSGSRLFVALDTTGQVAIFDTVRDRHVETIGVTAPESLYANPQKLGGANTNALALAPDGRTLLVSNGGQNSIAVVRLGRRAMDMPRQDRKRRAQDQDDDEDETPDRSHSEVVGLVPTGWYPSGVAASRDGATWYVINGKHPTGPNARWCHEMDPVLKRCISNKMTGRKAKYAENGTTLLLSEGEYIPQLEKAGILSFPSPSLSELARLTQQVAHNNGFDRPERDAADERLFSFLREHIKHVIYIIKENRTYDQILGDLPSANGDARLTIFPQPVSPNHHVIASNFVTLDNFLVSGEGSWTGWDWSVSAQTNQFREDMETANMRGNFLGEYSGLNRNINVAIATSEERHAQVAAYPADPDLLPGEHDVAAPDGPGADERKRHLWDAALAKGLTVRNWGFFGDYRLALADLIPNPPRERDPYARQLKVFASTKSSLAPYSDPYFRDFDPGFPDYWRLKEWQREFAGFVAQGTAPNLMLVRLAGDHLGQFDTAIDGVNTPETQMADNDYALGLLIETVAKSPFARDTLIVSVEDDACDGPDHVDAQRSVMLFAGAYVRQHARISTRYTTVSLVKTLEEILGLPPMGLNDAMAAPMSDIFDPAVTTWSYEAIVPDVLRSTRLPLPTATHAYRSTPRHSAAYWAKVMAGQDFSEADRIQPESFNRALWHGLKGDVPYPRSH